MLVPTSLGQGEPDWPPALLSRLDPASATEDAKGRLGNRVIRVVDRVAGPTYLKVGSGDAAKDLRAEAARLEWIGDRLPVPKPLYVGETAETFLLLTAIPGRPSHECLDALGPRAVVELFATALRAVHGIPTVDCPFDHVYDREIAAAEQRLDHGVVDKEAFEQATGDQPDVVLEWLKSHGDLLTDMVFTHGDYALPNLLVNGGQVSGLLDWGIAGVADRHRDFMSAELTLRRNVGDTWAPLFYEIYGTRDVDRERIRFYWLLDQFF